MNRSAFARPKQKNSPTFSPIFGKKLLGRTFTPEPANEARDVSNPDFGHNFGNVQVESPSFKQSCPLALSGPAHCPFGGACHTCPPRIQAKLKIGQPGDKYEQEADRVAEQVMRMLEPQVQRKGCLSCSDINEEEQIQTKPITQQITPMVQRQEAELEEEDEEEILQTKGVPGQTPEVTRNVQMNINNLRGAGKPLPESERSFFETRLGYDFSQVRVHSGSRAEQLTRAVNARAFTVGRDVVFGARQYAPETNIGQRLLAHELTHVVQQRFVPTDARNTVQRTSDEYDSMSSSGSGGGSGKPSDNVPDCSAVMGGRQVDHWLAGDILGQHHTYINFKVDKKNYWLVEAGPLPSNKKKTGAWAKKGKWDNRGNRIRTNYKTKGACKKAKNDLLKHTSTYHSKGISYDATNGPNSNSFTEHMTYKCPIFGIFHKLTDHKWDYWRNHSRPF